MNDNIFRILATILFVGGASISIYYRRKADRAGGEKISLKDEGLAISVALRVTGLILWAGVLAYLLHPAWLARTQIDLPEWARWVGFGMGAFSVILAYWVFKHLGDNITPTVVTRTNHSLVTSGPYRWVRHPLYSMGLLSYFGFALLSENWLMGLLSLLVFIILLIRLPKEEAGLIKKFGDEYRGYMRRTGRFFPKLPR